MLLHKLVSLLLLPYFLKNSLQVYKHNHIYCCTDIIGVAIIIRAERKLQTRHGASTVREVILVNKEYDTPILPLKYSFNIYKTYDFVFFLLIFRSRSMLLTLLDHLATNEGHAIERLIKTNPVIVGLRLRVVPYIV